MIRWLAVIAWLAAAVLGGADSVIGAEASGGQANALLRLGLDSRGMGMGSAYTAVACDASAVYWNSAGLACLVRPELNASYTRFPVGGEYTQLALALPLNAFAFPADGMAGSLGSPQWGGVSIWILRLATAYDIEARRVDSLNPDYLFSDIQGGYGLGFGWPLSREWQLGVNVKGLYHQLDQDNAHGWGADAGVRYQTAWGVVLGMQIRDAYSAWYWSTGRYELFPLTVKLGAAYSYSWVIGQKSTLGSDLEYDSVSHRYRVHLGLEYAWQEILFLRGGWDDGVWAMGAGLGFPWVGWGRAGLQLQYTLLQDRIAGWDQWMGIRLVF